MICEVNTLSEEEKEEERVKESLLSGIQLLGTRPLWFQSMLNDRWYLLPLPNFDSDDPPDVHTIQIDLHAPYRCRSEQQNDRRKADVLRRQHSRTENIIQNSSLGRYIPNYRGPLTQGYSLPMWLKITI